MKDMIKCTRCGGEYKLHGICDCDGKDWAKEERERSWEQLNKAHQKIGALVYYLTEFCEITKNPENPMYKFRIENLAELAGAYLEEKS